MTHLSVYDDVSNVPIPWLLQHYPKLTELDLFPRFVSVIQELTIFFEQNPKIQGFSTSFDFLWQNRDQFINSKLTLNILSVGDFQNHSTVDMQKMCDLLKELHESKVFKRLHLNFEENYQQIWNQIVLLPGLERLRICKTVDIFNVSRVIGLKELHLPDGLTTNDIQILAENLVNLNEVTVGSITSDDLLPFMRYSKKLKKLHAHLNGGILNLPKLNKEREQLVNAQKVIIYVPDNSFLATKWKTHYGYANMELVEMQRSNSALCEM